jgi:hypothetical protein
VGYYLNILPKVSIFKGFDNLESQNPSLSNSGGYSENN